MRLLSWQPLLLVLPIALLFAPLHACSDAVGNSSGAVEDEDDSDDDSSFKKKESNEEKSESSSTKLKEEKEKKPDTTVIRRQMTNVSDRITRAQANLQRTEQLRNSSVERRNATKSELAQIALKQTGGGGVSIGGGGGSTNNSGAVKKSKAELEKLVIVQDEEVAKFDAQIKAIEDEIAQFEAELEALTLKLEKK